MSSPARYAHSNLWLLGFAALLLVGCSRLQGALHPSQDMRSQAIQTAQKSCVQSMRTQLHNAPPQMAGKIDIYCTCAVTKGIANLSDAELRDGELSGGKISPPIMAKLSQGAQTCLPALQAP